jgi:hypothetical protein
MELILAEQLLLLLLDDESGADQSIWGQDPGLAGALLLDLAAAGAVYEQDGKLAADPGRRPEHPLLGEAYGAIAGAEKPRDAKAWVGRLPTALKPLGTRVADGLVAQGVLREHKRKLLGLIPQTRYPEVDGGYEDDLRERLRAVLSAEREPTRDEATLIALLKAYDKVKTLVPKDQRKAAKARAEAIADAGIAGKAVEAALQDIETAIVAAVAVSATSAAVTGSS